ncbi:MAG: hypothetical protein P1U34_08145 [Coxiellaceae bacterium]|nr:hypothetical protein [Coxiellaceae bacterium]
MTQSSEKKRNVLGVVFGSAVGLIASVIITVAANPKKIGRGDAGLLLLGGLLVGGLVGFGIARCVNRCSPAQSGVFKLPQEDGGKAGLLPANPFGEPEAPPPSGPWGGSNPFA